MSRTIGQQVLTLDDRLGFRPRLEECLPGDTEQLEQISLSEQIDEIHEKISWHVKAVKDHESWLRSPFNFNGWWTDVNVHLDAIDAAWIKFDKLKSRCDQLERIIKNRPKLCSVIAVVQGVDPVNLDEMNRHLSLGWFAFRAIASGTFRTFMPALFCPVPGVIRFRAMRLEHARRELAALMERFRQIALRAEESCRSAIDRGLSLLVLDALIRLLGTLAIEALHLIRPEPPPRVLAAGGQLGLHVPLN